MTLQEHAKDVKSTAEAARKSGQTITINESLGYIAIDHNNGEEYFLHIDEASWYLDEVKGYDLYTEGYCTLEDIILSESQSW